MDACMVLFIEFSRWAYVGDQEWVGIQEAVLQEFGLEEGSDFKKSITWNNSCYYEFVLGDTC